MGTVSRRADSRAETWSRESVWGAEGVVGAESGGRRVGAWTSGSGWDVAQLPLNFRKTPRAASCSGNPGAGILSLCGSSLAVT